jgi:high-affinity Fe2+/Pb2+ permease
MVMESAAFGLGLIAAMLVWKSAHAIKCMVATANAAGQQSRILRGPSRFGFLNCGENGPDDILKFP